MKKILIIAIAMLCMIACSKKEINLTIKGEIEGLKNGKVYLQKLEDTALVNLDSIVLDGKSNFVFETYIEEPQVLYLFLDQNNKNEVENRIDFFAEKGEMTIFTSLENFGKDVVVEGSENQKKFEEYRAIAQRFNNQNLDLIEERFIAESTGNDSLLQQSAIKFDRLLKRKYLYTINFAINNKDKELAPYITLSQVYDANIKYLDTVYNSLTPEIQNSRYGKELGGYIIERKEMEKETALN